MIILMTKKENNQRFILLKFEKKINEQIHPE
jgi:hypothetical protein